MRRPIITLPTLGLLIVAIGCGDDGETTGPPSGSSCAGGQGSVVEFCRQVEHYEAGFGVEGDDVITATCLVGPEGATVSNEMNGTYYCGGTYKLTTFPNATIDLNWGGSTSYSEYQADEVTAGEGTFSVKVVKISGGSGNMFLSMSSGSSWMFDVVLVNTLCNGGATDVVRSQTQGSISTVREGATVEKMVPWSYGSN